MSAREPVLGREIALPRHLSYSSLSSYAECGQRWLLERGRHLDKRTWWSTVAGRAIHKATELYDLGEGTAKDLEALIPEFLELEQRAEEDAGVEIVASGKRLASHGLTGGPNKKDKVWWLQEGPRMFRDYVAWRRLARWELPLLPDGRPAVEVPIDVEMGGRPQVGYIDRVFIRPDGEVVILDLKFGNEPAGRLQLGVYRVGLLRKHGIEANVGVLFMGPKGELTQPTDLTHYDEAWMDAQFAQAWRGIQAGVFLPNVTSLCRGCAVRDWCRAVGGRNAVDLPVDVDLVEQEGPDEAPRAEAVTDVTS